jgi:microcystin degradation protein MlrC
MRVAVAGFMHESNTFNPLPTDRAAFVSQSFTRGPALVEEWREAHHEVGGFLEVAEREGFEPVPLVMAWAMPSGPVTDEVFEEVVSLLLSGLEREKPDGLLLALHGAMVGASHLDADGEILTRLRAAVGPDFPIAVTLDLHGNVSDRLVGGASFTLAYQTCPHVDQRERGKKAARLMRRLLLGEIRPCQALAKPPLLVNIMTHDTSVEPLRPFMERIRALEQQPGILAASLLPGFYFADVPHMGPSVIVVADGDPQRARAEADQLADALCQAREQFVVTRPEAPQAVSQALQAREHPVVLVDTGDNVGGGSAGDGTVLLQELLQQQASGSVVMLYAPQEVLRCQQAGPGHEVSLDVGGKVDRLHGSPVPVTGRVKLLHEGTYIEPEIRHGGKRVNRMGLTAVVELPRNNLLVLTTYRHPPFSLRALTCLGIEPERQRILVVKAAIAYKAAYVPIAGRIIEVDTPGLTAINPARFTYRHLKRAMYPLA